MNDYRTRIDDFLAQKRIAVVGVSRDEKQTANGIYRKFRDSGYQVFPINPNTAMLEGDRCYPTIKDVPGGVDGVMIVTRPEITEQVVQDCIEAGATRVWMHNNTMLPSSASEAAVAACQEHRISVISAGCPMMFLNPGFFHACWGWGLRVTGRLA